VIRYVHTQLGWADVGFELGNDPVDRSGRRWDAWVSGILYQFKSWYAWTGYAEKTFLRQILQDYHDTFVGQDIGLRWVFETSLSRDDLVRKMKDALAGVISDLKTGKEPPVPGYTETIALFIFSRVDAIVIKA
jgi:hypothetical protein